MWTEKRNYQQGNWPSISLNAPKASPQLTPRSKLKPNIPLPSSRLSVTPSRVQERVSASPLRVPLERAIQKCTRDKSTERPNSRSRLTNKSSRQGDSSIIRKGLFDDQELEESNTRVHSETIRFLKKYFDFENHIPLEHFIQRIVQDYGDLWSNQNADQLMQRFSWKVVEIFGASIDPRELITSTKNNGMIGLILQIFQSINQSEQSVRSYRSQAIAFSKSPNVMSINKSFQEQLGECANTQHLKNILQEFMETMYAAMEKQIYDKFNSQMKRMVLKHREADRTLKRVTELLTHNADYFEVEAKWKAKVKNLEEGAQGLVKQLQRMEEELKKERQFSNEIKLSKSKVEEENYKLRQNLDKFQNILLNKFQQPPQLSRHLSSTPSAFSHSRLVSQDGLADRTHQFVNRPNYPPEQSPIQIKIDTQIVQNDSGRPNTHTTSTTFTEQNKQAPPAPFMQPLYDSKSTQRSTSPIQLGGSRLYNARPSIQGGIPYGTNFNGVVYSPINYKNPNPHC